MDIGFITPNIHSGSARLIWPVMADLAKKQGHRLFLYPGGRLGRSEAAEQHRNRIYEVVRDSGLTSLITWTSALGGIISPEAVGMFHARFTGLPLVALGDPLAGAAAITLDAYRGMVTLLEHFYTRHGARRFAFIRGPEEHQSAQDRFRAFTDFLRSRRLAEEAQWISPCLGWAQGGEAAAIITDIQHLVPGRDFDALLASSDLQLLDTLNSLADRGYQAPRDFIAGGFNDSPESRLISPGFTTVRMPFAQAGEEAFLRAAGQKTGNISLTPRLVIRRSCGCFSHPKDLRPQPVVEALALEEPRFIQLTSRDMATQIQGGEEELQAWIVPLVQSMIQTLSGRDESAFFTTLENILSRVLNLGLSLYVWQDALSAAHVRCRLGVEESRRPALDLMIERGRLLISDAMERQAVTSAWESGEFFRRMQGFEQQLLGLHSVEGLSGVLARGLGDLGISLGIVMLHRGGTLPGSEYPVPGTGYRVVPSGPHGSYPGAGGPDSREAFVTAGGYRIDREGRIEEVPPGQAAGPGRIVPGSCLAWLQAGAYGVFPLSDESGFYGYALVSMDISRSLAYEQLRLSLTKAMKTIRLLEDLRAARDAARQAEETKNRFLRNASNELVAPLLRLSRLPGITPEIQDLLTLARDLEDVSRAQGNDLVLTLEAVYLPDYVDSQIPVTWETPEEIRGLVPLTDLDLPRVSKVLLGLADLVSPRGVSRPSTPGPETSGAPGSAQIRRNIRADWRLEARGIVLRLRSSLDTPPAAAALPGISWQLYQQIMILHGGSVSWNRQTGQGEVVFPYPTMSGRPPRPRGEFSAEPSAPDSRPMGVTLVRCGAGPDTPQSGWRGLWAPGAMEVIREITPEELTRYQDRVEFLVIDLGGQPSGLEVLAAQLGGLHGLADLPLGVVCSSQSARQLLLQGQGGAPQSPASEDHVHPGQAPRRLGRAMVHHRTGSSPGPVLIFLGEQPPDPHAGIGSLKDGVILRGSRDLYLPDLPRNPRAIILAEDNPDFLWEIRQDPRYESVPLGILAPGFPRISQDPRLSILPRVCLLHQGVYAPDELAGWVERLAGEEDLLPAQTAVLVKKAIAYFDRHFSQSISRWMLAEQVHVSEDYLTRIFHKETGLSPWDYLTRLRIAKGARLLAATGASVLEISQEIGFTDQAYFCRVFRKRTGLSPTKYRNEVRKGI